MAARKRIEKGKQAREACVGEKYHQICPLRVTGSVLYSFHMWSNLHRANWPVPKHVPKR